MKKDSCMCTSFRELKSALEREGYVLARESAPQAAPLPDEEGDRECFLKAMADVREIREFRSIPIQRQAKVLPLRKTGDEGHNLLVQVVRGERRMRLSDTGEYVEWTNPAVKIPLVKRLHRGDFSVQDSLDLHGMTLPEAEIALHSFLRDAVRRNYGCVKVIHGRGRRSPHGPVLKKAVTEWLQRYFRKSVLAYATAKDRDGGLGATYIILKSR